jgi:two-component system chemotaxis sensor kinase CheA
MITEALLEKIEDIAVNLIDLDEKQYPELAAILSSFDKIKEEINSFENTSLSKILASIYEYIEKLILRDIDPISDPNAIYNGIYQNFDNLKKAIVEMVKNKTFADNGETPPPPPEIPDEFKAKQSDTFDLDSIDDVIPTDSTDIETDVEPEVEAETAPPPVVEEPIVVKAPPPPPSNEVLESDAADDELFMDFVNEAKEYVSTLENLMLEVEQTPNDLNLINEIFRPFHTLKGVSGFMGLNKINHISHEAENILDKARNGKLDITPDHSVLIFKTIDIIKTIISGLDVQNKHENVSDEEVEAIVKILKAANEPGWTMGSECEAVVLSPTNVSEVSPPPAPSNTSPTTSSTDNPFVEIAKDIKVQTNVQPPTTTAPVADADAAKKQSAEDSIRVKIDKLDFLIDMVGELVITYNLFHQDKNILNIFDHEFQKKKSQLQRVISDLQKASMSLRMVPIGQTFTKMKRVIRDYTAQHKKQIDLVLIGEDTEIDRNMVDSLNEPLVHMIRNSCDHGIEANDVRTSKGKPTKGTITLKAYHKGNTIVIDVQDDGNGVNKDRVLAKAIERGLVSESANLTDSQIYNLVFLPGFSTMEVVSTVSGRGVGMDVVMQAIKLLGGSVEVLSEWGKGSTFRIALPLTLAIIDGMLVKVSGELYIIPIANVRRTLKPTKDMLNSVMNKAETVKVEDSLIPIVRLNRKFKFMPQNEDLSECLLIIIQAGDKIFSIAVDDLIGIQSVVVKTLGEKFKDLDGISGATIMGDGKVGLILDCNKLDVES